MHFFNLLWLQICSVTCFCGEALETRKEGKMCFWNWNKQGFPTRMASSCDWGGGVSGISVERETFWQEDLKISQMGQFYCTHQSFSFAFKEMREAP